MSQQQSPFIEAAYGWNFGENNWNGGMDNNLLKFSYLFDRNVDGVVSSLPAATSGAAYFLTTDNRLYFGVGSIWYSTPTPKWFVFYNRASGDAYQFNGTTAVAIDSPASIDSRLDAVELFVTNLANQTNAALGDNLVGYRRSLLASSPNIAPRTLHNVGNDLPVYSTEFQGVDKTGVTSSTAGLQSLINYIASVSVAGGVIEFPEGNYKFQNLTFPAVGDWVIRGQGSRRTKFILESENQALFNFDDNYAFTHKQFENVGFYGGTFVNGRGIQATRVRELKFLNCHVEHLAYNMLIDRARGIIIDNVTCRTSGTWFFHSTNDDDYIQNIMISNVIDPVGTDIFGIYGLTEAWHFKDVVNANMVNVSYSGLAGTTRFINIIGKTEGVFGYDIICGWPSVGILFSPFTYAGSSIIGTIRPQYCGFTNVGLDQPAVSSAVITGDYHFFTGCWMANGTTRNNTGAGVEVQANAKGIRIVDTYIAWHQLDGIVIANGAQDIQLRGCMFTMNNGSAGANFDIRDQTAVGQLLVRDCTPTLTPSSSTQRIINGSTSNVVSAMVNTSVATTAVTTAEDLKSYTIPAGTLKAGQLVRLRAWGTTAANANTKTVRVFFGSLSLGGFAAAANGLDWQINVDVWVKSTTTQNSIRSTILANASAANFENQTENLALATVVKVQGQNGTASAGDITCEGFTVEIVS